MNSYNQNKNKQDLIVEIVKNRAEAKKDTEDLKEHFDKKFDKVLNVLDTVVGEVKNMRIEQAAHQSDHDRIRERFEAIEKVPAIAHELK